MKRAAGSLVALCLMFVLAACGSEDGDSSASDGGKGTITLGIIPSWTDGLSMAYLWQNLLEADGYTVEISEIGDAAPLYTGLAKGNVDIYPSAWSEVTHADYMERYGDDLEDLGAYYPNAKLTFAVPEYSKMKSIEDLKAHADELDNKIIGIEAGAGLTKATKESVMPAYGLEDDFTLVESSTTAMLTTLQKSISDKDEVVVTLWRPFWANAKFPIRDLEDPKGALGESEALHFIAHKGFSDEYPEVAEMMGKAEMTDEQYGTLEDLVVNEYEKGEEAEAVAAWLEDNQDWVATLK